MLREMIKAAALKVAKEHRREGNFDKLQAALWLARRAANIKPLEHRSLYADAAGCVHAGRSKLAASLRAVDFNRAYA